MTPKHTKEVAHKTETEHAENVQRAAATAGDGGTQLNLSAHSCRPPGAVFYNIHSGSKQASHDSLYTIDYFL